MQKVNPELGVPAIQKTQNKIHSVWFILVQIIKSPTWKKKSPAKETRLLPIRTTAPKSATTVITPVCLENLESKGKGYLKSIGPIFVLKICFPLGKAEEAELK